jgi:hypothetical protein
MPRQQRRTAKHAARRSADIEDRGKLVSWIEELVPHTDTGPVLTGEDVDADWQSAAATGEEGVGGSVATPDQGIVDDIGRALGVERDDEEEIMTSEEILKARDRRRWEVEAEDAADERRRSRP